MLPDFYLKCEQCGASGLRLDQDRFDIQTHPNNECDMAGMRYSLWIDPSGNVRVDRVQTATVHEQKEFKPGDVVKSRNGGPAMTVETVMEKYVDCVWFEHRGTPTRKPFSREELIPCVPTKWEPSKSSRR